MSCSNKSTIIVKQPKPYRFLVTAKTATGGGGGATNAKKLIYDSATAKAEQVENAEQALDKLYGESVRYTEQTKTESEKTQARANIGAASGADVAKKEDKIEVVQNAPTTITIEPNKLYHWNGVESLDITLGETTSPTDVFIIQFSSATTPTNFVLKRADSLQLLWEENGAIEIQAGQSYEVIINNNLVSWGGFK